MRERESREWLRRCVAPLPSLHARALTVEQHDGLLERQRVPDLHLAVRPLQDARRQEQEEGGCLLDALEHALLGQVDGPVVIPHLRAADADLVPSLPILVSQVLP